MSPKPKPRKDSGPRRGYQKAKPLVVHPATFVPLSEQDEQRAIAALAELLAPLFNDRGELRPDPAETAADRSGAA